MVKLNFLAYFMCLNLYIMEESFLSVIQVKDGFIDSSSFLIVFCKSAVNALVFLL